MDKYNIMIGLEMHCQISKTNSKVFSSSKNSFNELPNDNVTAIDMAFPGVLPMLNKEALRKALKASIILGCKQPEYVKFERKNYYYPDLPKGYQITQETKPNPVGIYGKLEYECNGEMKTVRINNIHLEEDSASQDHYDDYSLLDYNRAGVPLLELVTEPDLHSAEEAVAFLENIRRIYQYTDISEADAKKGQIRCDVNVSIIEKDLDINNPDNWGTRVEVKNVNSFGSVRDVINYEIKRQIEAKENNEYDKIMQETRRWDEQNGKTVFMRSKSDAIDYKYFVEPNIPPFKLTSKFLEDIKNEIPVLPNERIKKYLNEYNFSLVDATTIVKDKKISDYFEKCIEIGMKPNTASNWVLSTIIGYINKDNIDINEFYITPEYLNIITSNIEENNISSKQGKEIFIKSIEEKKSPEEYISSNKQNSNENELEEIINKILDNNINQVTEYKNGRTNLFQFFVGQVMKETKGTANPKLTSEILNKKLNN